MEVLEKESKHTGTAQERAVKIVDALVSGRLSPALEKEIREWFSTEEDIPMKMAAVEEVFNSAVYADTNPGSEVYAAFEELARQLGIERKPAAVTAPPRVTRKLKRRRMMWMAAAVMLPLVAAATWLFVGRTGTPVADPVKYAMSVSTGDEVRQVMLADGSTVVLNDNSRLDYNEEGKVREVFIVGEAFFDVESNRAEPFLVNTGALQVEVTGTAFNVDAREGAVHAGVTLLRGEVSVVTGSEVTLMEPGQEFSLDLTTGEGFVAESGDTSQAWWNTPIEFTAQTLTQIFDALAGYTGMEFEFDRAAFGGKRYSIKFDYYDRPERILSVLRDYTGRFSFSMAEDGTVRIEEK